jgi:hypothetical protein
MDVMRNPELLRTLTANIFEKRENNTITDKKF